MSIVFKEIICQSEDRTEKEKLQEQRAIQAFEFPWPELIITISLLAIGFGCLWLMH